jgi:hypothetical protein
MGAAHLGLRASDTMHFNSHNAPHAIVLKQFLAASLSLSLSLSLKCAYQADVARAPNSMDNCQHREIGAVR